MGQGLRQVLGYSGGQEFSGSFQFMGKTNNNKKAWLYRDRRNTSKRQLSRISEKVRLWGGGLKKAS